MRPLKEAAIKKWPREKVTPAYDAIKADPKSAVSIEQIRANLKKVHDKALARTLDEKR